MSQRKAKSVRKHLNDNHHAWVEARWRLPFRLLPGLPSGWFGIMLFPRFQWFFKFRMIHAITTGPDEALRGQAMDLGIIDDPIIQGEDNELSH